MLLSSIGLGGCARTASLRSSLIATRSVLGKRFNSQAVRTTLKGEKDILVAQRGNRPVSPHLTIYQPQITWYLSSCHRISGVMMGATFFTVTIAFGVSTLLGLGLTTDKLKEFYREKVPNWANWTFKGCAAYLFAFHFANGMRHLIWDTGNALSIKGVNRTGLVVLAICLGAGTNLLLS